MPDAQFLAAERDVEVHSEQLRKELTLPNLVFTQVLSILGLSWIGTAGRLGSSHLTFWIAAIALFHIPQAWVVIHLNNEMPLEGGLYQWAKLRFNEMTGFLVAWNMLLYSVIFASEMGLLFMNNLAYALGPSGAWLANSKPAICAASIAITAGLIIMARVGLSLGKWIHGFSGFMILFLFAAMAAFALPHWFSGAVAHPPIAFTIPAFTLLNLNILGKMGFGAFGGFDTCSIFAGECRGAGESEVARTIRRSVWIATPIIAGAFILGTACVLVFVKPGDIDLISPITQVLNRGLNAAGFSGSATSVIGALIVATLIGQALLSFNYAARLPLVAGWDSLLPPWSTRLHPKYQTPVGSIAVLGAIILAIALFSALGSGNQEAYQVLQNSNGICYGLAYLALFAIPLFAPGERTSLPLRVAAVSGFLMTLLNVVLSVFPIIDVPDAALFAVKVGSTVVILNGAGALLYWRGAIRKRANMLKAIPRDPLTWLYPPIEPFRTGRLQVSPVHEIYFEESGNPAGKPVIFIHGGPGGGSDPKQRRFFHPEKYRIVNFDQRGCGQSTPYASLEANTTWDLVADIEKIRQHLGIERWQVFGGSWGSTLGLAYAETHPERVTEIILRGIFLLRKQEIDWFYQRGASVLYPDAWEPFLEHIPEAERGDLLSAYHRRLTSDDPAVRLAAAKIWSGWEGATSKLLPDPAFAGHYEEDEFALAFARIECHYFSNKGFLEPEDQLLRDTARVRHIPGVIVQGRYDVVCPMESAWALHRAWPEADLIITPDCGHSAFDPPNSRALVAATDRYSAQPGWPQSQEISVPSPASSQR